MTEKPEYQPAFPGNVTDELTGEIYENPGLTKLEYFAAHAPDAPDQWIKDSIADGYRIEEAIASWRFCYAKAMVAEYRL